MADRVEQENQDRAPRIGVGGSNDLVPNVVMPREFRSYIVSERELRSLGLTSAAGSLFTALLGIAIGAAISLGITLRTVDIPEGKTYTAFWVGFLMSLFASFAFLVLSAVMRIRSFLEVRTIKRESEERRREMLTLSSSV